ncbi:MAG: hypothetical protein KDD56_01175 [Bdellovibrionales bacterium]|nr:hypothetical protein [Bdellovibrionales bacterium]
MGFGSLISAEDNSRDLQMVEGIAADTFRCLSLGSPRERTILLGVFIKQLLNCIENSLTRKDVVTNDTISSIKSFDAAVRVSLSSSSQGQRFQLINELPSLLTDTEQLIEFLSTLSQALENGEKLTFNDYFTAGNDTAIFYSKLLPLAFNRESRNTTENNQSRSIVSRLVRTLEEFSKLKDQDQLYKMISDVRVQLDIVHLLATQTLNTIESGSKKAHLLMQLIPETLACLYAFRLIEKFPHEPYVLHTSDLDFTQWRDLKRAVGKIVKDIGPAFLAA